MLTHYTDLIARAYREHWAIIACNTTNLELSQAIIEAAEELQSPVIIQTSEKAIDYAGLEEITSLIKSRASHASIPVILNLDHGKSFDIVERCVIAGYTAVMRDASDVSFEDNVKETQRAVLIAHEAGIGAEGELGHIGGSEDDISSEVKLTDPKEAKRFVQETGVDLFAPALGNAHGYVNGARIDLDHLDLLRRAVSGIPMVLHGSSGLPERDIVASIRKGIVKINVDTDLRHAFTESLRKNLQEHQSLYDPRGILGPAKDAVKARVKEKIILFGSSGKAK